MNAIRVDYSKDSNDVKIYVGTKLWISFKTSEHFFQIKRGVFDKFNYLFMVVEDKGILIGMSEKIEKSKAAYYIGAGPSLLEDIRAEEFHISSSINRCVRDFYGDRYVMWLWDKEFA